MEKWKRCIEDDRNGPKENERNMIDEWKTRHVCKFWTKKKNCTNYNHWKSILQTWKVETNLTDWWNHDLPHNVQCTSLQKLTMS